MIAPDIMAHALRIARVHIEHLNAYKPNHDLTAVRDQISKYVSKTFLGEYGHVYLSEIRALGREYADLGLPLEFIFSSAQLHLECIYPLAARRFASEPLRLVEVIQVIQRVTNWNTQLIIGSFVEYGCLLPLADATHKLQSEVFQLAECTDLLQAGLAELLIEGATNPQLLRKFIK